MAQLVPVWVPVAAVIFAVTGTLGGLAAGLVGLVSAVVVFGSIALALLHADRQLPAPNPEREEQPGLAVTPATSA